MFSSGWGERCADELVRGLCLGCHGMGGCLGPVSGMVGWCYVCVVSVDSLCIWQVHVSVYGARRIPAHLRCTQCSIMFHLIDICSYRVFICGRYSKYRFACLWLSA